MQSQNAITLHHQPTPTCIVGATLGSPCLGCSPWHAHPTPSLPPYPHQIPKNLSRETLAISQKYRASINLFNSQNLSRIMLAISQKYRASTNLFNSQNLSRETLAISQKYRAPLQNTHKRIWCSCKMGIQIFTNVSSGAFQPTLADFVPEDQRGTREYFDHATLLTNIINREQSLLLHYFT